MTTTINRVSAGIPTGGQFAEHNRGESTVALAPQGLQFGEYVDVERHDYLDSTFTESVNAASGFTDDDFKTLSDNYLVAAIWSTTDDSDDDRHAYGVGARWRRGGVPVPRGYWTDGADPDADRGC